MEQSNLQKLQPGFFYQLVGKDNQILQVILSANKKIQCHGYSIQWISEKYKIYSKEEGVLSWFKSNKSPVHRIEVLNESSSPMMVGLAQAQHHGEISLIKSIPLNGYYVRKINMLCATDAVEMSNRPLPLTQINSSTLLASLSKLIGNNFYFCKFPADALIDNGIFIQSNGPILSKQLSVNEAFHVNVLSVIAIQDTCRVSSLDFSNNPAINRNKYLSPVMVSIHGPGAVYFSPFNETAINMVQSYSNSTGLVGLLKTIFYYFIIPLYMMTIIVKVLLYYELITLP